MVKRHTKPTPEDPQGGIIEKEGSIHLSNVMPVDPGQRQADPRQGEARGRPAAAACGKSGTVIEAAK